MFKIKVQLQVFAQLLEQPFCTLIAVRQKVLNGELSVGAMNLMRQWCGKFELIGTD